MSGRGRAAAPRRVLALAALLVVLAAGSAVTDLLGVGSGFGRVVAGIGHLLAGAPPASPAAPGTPVAPTLPPLPTPTPGPAPVATAVPSPTPTAAPTPTPPPERLPVDISLLADQESVFASQVTKSWCAPAAIQVVLATLELADTSAAFQRSLAGRIGEWTTHPDSRNGGWGPVAMIDALRAYGALGYELRAFDTREAALRDAAVTLTSMRSPVILLAWRGAHAWVMTGYRADADPMIFPDATITGAYVLDPWYPRVSTLWGPSDPPGTFQDEAEMIRNYLPWKRPEGRYPDRDGKYLAIVPTIPLAWVIPER